MGRFLLVLVACVRVANAAPESIDDAVKRAAAAGKPLLVEVSASWCGPCHLFENSVLPDQRVQAALHGVVYVHYDGEDGPGIAAAERYHVTAYPTFVVIDARGIERA